MSDGDDLTKLPGISPEAQTALNAIGIHYVAQVTEWGPGDWETVEAHLQEALGGMPISRPSLLTGATRLVESRAAASSEDE